MRHTFDASPSPPLRVTGRFADLSMQTVRKINTVVNTQYFCALWEIAKTLIGMQIQQQALKARFIAYKDVSLYCPMHLADATDL